MYELNSPTAIDDAIDTIKRYAQVSGSEIDTMLANLLEQSKSGSQYRPFAIAAYHLAISPPRKGIMKAEGVEWQSATEAISGLLTMQEAIDAADPTSVPDAWNTSRLKAEICACKEATMVVPMTSSWAKYSAVELPRSNGGFL